VKVEFELAGGGPAALVRRAAMNALTHVRGQELKTFQTLARYVRENVDRLTAIRAMQNIARSQWPKEEAPALIEVVLADIRKLPPAERTSPAALDEMEFAHALTTLLPADQARKVRAELNELGVRVIRIGTLFERMSFDKDVVVVRAGKPVEFLFENTDLMPHNLVISQPGSLEEIGLLSEATAQSPEAAKRDFVPPSKQVLLASRLLQPRDTQKLTFNAPTKPGIYPIVCTYPGHWRRMYAALYVVEDLDAYLENPEAYLASNPLTAIDPLLKDRRPRTNWTLEELAPGVEQLAGRSYTSGKHLFKVANCVACHKVEDAGNAIGPDLVKLDPKYQPLDILKEMLDPSAKINEKFQTYTIELDSGKVLTALVLEETPQAIKVIENPLAKTEPLVLKPAEIVSRTKSPISIMPKGLLDKLTRDEILDLIAYVAARGNKQAALFKGGHDHAGHGQAHKH
jgi:putative heme-binding domain-containing protein